MPDWIRDLVEQHTRKLLDEERREEERLALFLRILAEPAGWWQDALRYHAYVVVPLRQGIWTLADVAKLYYLQAR